MDTPMRIALLFDGDNANPKYIPRIIKVISGFGEINICKVYADWAKVSDREMGTLATGKEITGDADPEYFTAAELGLTSEKRNLNVINANGVMVSYSGRRCRESQDLSFGFWVKPALGVKGMLTFTLLYY